MITGFAAAEALDHNRLQSGMANMRKPFTVMGLAAWIQGLLAGPSPG